MVDTMKDNKNTDKMKARVGNFAGESVTSWNKLTSLKRLYTSIPAMCSSTLEEPELQKIIKEGLQYDLAFNNAFLNDCTMPIAAKVARYVILLSPTSIMLPLSYELNIPYPMSYIPNKVSHMSAPMNFLERMTSSTLDIVMFLMQKYVQDPIVNGIIQEKLPGYPLVEDVKRNASMLFTNRLSAVDGAIPTMPHVIEIGGSVGLAVKPLPKDFEDFIQGAGKEGFIYMALGSVVPEELMTETRKQIVIEAFSRLPQRVIWKFKEQRSDIPANVKTVTWAPQQDILGHPKLRAFISHGGHSSLDEALHHGVPVLGMPVFGDQPANVFKAEATGYALGLQWEDLTVETLLEKLNEIVNNTRYRETAKHLSVLVKDQHVSATDRAVYWTEYVIRHDGARHLRSAADQLNFFQYFLLDVLAAVVATVTVVLYVIYKLVCLMCCRSKSKQKKVKKN
jgi:glucuronosyltransferase